MSLGTIKWFSSAKGYGFLIPDEGGKDIFVHHTRIEMDGFRKLEASDRVEYVLEQGPDGRQQAGCIRKIEQPSSARPKRPT
jgi:CspA family cold shock protein